MPRQNYKNCKLGNIIIQNWTKDQEEEIELKTEITTEFQSYLYATIQNALTRLKVRIIQQDINCYDLAVADWNVLKEVKLNNSFRYKSHCGITCGFWLQSFMTHKDRKCEKLVQDCLREAHDLWMRNQTHLRH